MSKTGRFFLLIFFLTLPIYSSQAFTRLTYGTVFLVATTKKLTSPAQREKNFPRMSFSVSTSIPQPFKITLKCTDNCQSMERLVSRKNLTTISFSKNEIKNNVYNISSASREHLFTLTVRILMKRDSVDAFLALPVDEWDNEYYCASLESQPFWALVMTSTDANNIEIYLNGSTSQSITLNSYAPHVEEIPANTVASFTALLPIGVIVGSSNSSFSRCSTEGKDHFLVEMLMPSSMSGRDFFTVHFMNDTNNGYIMIIAKEDMTSVTFRESSRESAHARTLSKHSTELLILDEHYYHITSDKPIQLFYFRRATCKGSENKGWASVLSLVVPTELFYYSYVVSNMKNSSSKMNLLIISERKYIAFISFDEPAISLSSYHNVTDKSEWLAGHVELPKGVLHVSSITKARFGCYIYSLEREIVSIMSPAGYIASSIDKTTCSKETGKPGDLIDNDCDGRIDEEIPDQKDNDGDVTIDEDCMDLTGLKDFLKCISLNHLTTVDVTSTSSVPHGTDDVDVTSTVVRELSIEKQVEQRKETIRTNTSKWSEWSAWECPRECNSTERFRNRHCVRESGKSLDCVGKSKETTKSDLCNKENYTCPLDCEEFRWDYGCNKDCLNCAKDCDKFTGECASCKEGYKHPKQSCHQECAAFEYGTDCSGDCLGKCWGDCDDRKTGACHGDKLTYIVMVGTPSLVVMGFMYVYFKKMKKFDDDSSESIRKMTAPRKFTRVKSLSIGSALTDATTAVSTDTEKSS